MCLLTNKIKQTECVLKIISLIIPPKYSEDSDFVAI